MAEIDTPAAARTTEFIVISICLTTTWTTLAMRLWVRIIAARTFGWDDTFILVTAIIFTGYCTDIILIETVGGAQHFAKLQFDHLPRLISMVLASFSLYIMTMVFFKISLGIFYLRSVIRPWETWAVYITVFLNTIYGIFLSFVATLHCGDPSEYLENRLKDACMSNNSLYIIQLTGGILNATTDWVLAVLPIFMLAKATMPVRAKCSIGALLLLGCIGSVISLVRIKYLKGLLTGRNFFDTAVPLCIWSIIECAIGISAASAATLRPLFNNWIDQGHTTNFFQNISANFTSRSGGSPRSGNNRDTDTMFGEWQRIPIQHEMSYTSMEYHARGSQSLARDSARIWNRPGIDNAHSIQYPHAVTSPWSENCKTIRNDSMRAGKNTTAPSPTIRKGSQRSFRQSPITRKESVRDKLISRPKPQHQSQVAPPTPTFGKRPQYLLRNDPRRQGSPNWLQDSHWGHAVMEDEAISSTPPSPYTEFI